MDMLLSSQPNADFYTLTQYTINVACINITNTIKLINVLISQSASNETARNHYKSCLEHFSYGEGALDDLEYSQKLLKKGDYQGVSIVADAIEADVKDCILGRDGNG
ncbi:uncharacterized protein LOC113866559 [Abrus precatorius]|uniref:Uncharacterized protein LOC113866559 n=1 Tax=Abrus precatorius TaxID=3816 RepID=A0A8B8LLB6_ABRPR|nr:uncharacterized protein LOC113866559 [Abrus precatorius]